MKFHPVVSIIFGLIVFSIFSLIIGFVIGMGSGIGGILYFVSFLLAGFTAAFLAKEMKVRYGFYEGICIIIFINLITLLSGWSLGNISSLIFGSVTGILLASVGAKLAVKIDKN